MNLRGGLIGGFLCLGAQAFAGTPAEDMAAAAARIAGAGKALAAANGPDQRVGALSDAIAAYQSALDVLRTGVSGASAREREIALDLDQRRDEIQHIIAALEAISLTPRPAQALHPQGPLGAARAAATMARLTPALRAEALELTAEYDEIAAVRALRQEGERDLATGIAALGAARTELGDTLARRAPPQPRGTEDPTLARLVHDSDTLTALAGKLAAVSGGGSGGAVEMPPLRRPIEGEIVRGFNEPDAAGVRRPGVLVQAPPLSLVSAPADAIVRYAGPFLDYGYVVVLEADDDTLVVLAGLAQVQVSTGDPVRSGGLLGLLGGPAFETGGQTSDLDAETDVASGSGADETLYIEIRHGQGPVDPGPMFTGENG